MYAQFTLGFCVSYAPPPPFSQTPYQLLLKLDIFSKITTTSLSRKQKFNNGSFLHVSIHQKNSLCFFQFQYVNLMILILIHLGNNRNVFEVF